MKQKILSFLPLVLILIIGIFLRFTHLDTNPPSLNWDEVAFAYNAHSLIETGKDEFGKSYPLYFESLDDYKLPVYIYMTVVSEEVFGYNNFAVRFPSAFFGSLTVLLIFFLCRLWFKNNAVSLLAALIFALLPWHIQFSRMAAEATVGLFFFLTGLVLFFYSLRKNSWILLLSLLFFALSTYTYLGFRFLAPLLVIILAISYRKQIFKRNLAVFIACVVAIAFGLLLCFDSYVNRNTSRLVGIAAVTPNTPDYQQDIVELVEDGKHNINLPRRLFHDSHSVSSINIVTNNYLSHFSPEFLFYNLNQTRHYTPEFGLLYLWMLPFIILGLFLLAKVKPIISLLIASLLLLPPVPAAFAFDAPNTIRTITLAVPFSMVVALALYESGKRLQRYPLFFWLFTLMITGIISLSAFHFYHQNAIHLPSERSSEWQYGRKEMTEYILKHQKEYDQIIVSTALEWPNVFFLYYSQYDPQKYLAAGGTTSGSWAATNNKINNIAFHPFVFPYDTQGEKILFIGKPAEFPTTAKPLEIIKYLDGKSAMYMVDQTQATLASDQAAK